MSDSRSAATAQAPSRPRRPSREDWEKAHERILELHPKQTLEQIIRKIEEEYGWRASSKSYKDQLKRWNLKKYIMRSHIEDGIEQVRHGDDSPLENDAFVKSLHRRYRESSRRIASKTPRMTPSLLHSLDTTPAPPSQYLADENIQSSSVHTLRPFGDFPNIPVQARPTNERMIHLPLSPKPLAQNLLTSRSGMAHTGATDIYSRIPPLSFNFSRPTIKYWATSEGAVDSLVGLCRIHETLGVIKDHEGTALPSAYLGSKESPPNMCTETIKQAIRENCLLAKESLRNSQSSFIWQPKAQAQGTSPGTQYWSTIKQAIYLSKMSQREKATEALLEANTLACDGAVNIRSLDSIREVLTTLSPVNTAVWPDVRVISLQNLIQISSSEFSQGHHATLVMQHLLKDGGDRQVSEDALKFMVEECTAVLGEEHTFTVRAQLALVKLLRRSHAYFDAACKAVQLLRICDHWTGPDSVWSRLVARELAHVFKDVGHPSEANKLGMDIVGVRRLPGQGDVVLHHDECAIYTMEDIAQNCDIAGDFENSAKWLGRAAENGWELWKSGPAMQHIVDKLERISKVCGRPDYASDWRRRCPSSRVRQSDETSSLEFCPIGSDVFKS